MQEIEVRVKHYKFSFDVEGHRDKYLELEEKLKGAGLYKCSYGATGSWEQVEDPDSKDGIVIIDTRHIFKDQYNTKHGVRLYEWREPEYRNKRIKEGYYIDPDHPGFQALRFYQNSLLKCPWCGKTYTAEDIGGKIIEGYCRSCIETPSVARSEIYKVKVHKFMEEPNGVASEVPQSIIDTHNKFASAAYLEATEKDYLRRLKELSEKRKETDFIYNSKKWIIENTTVERFLTRFIIVYSQEPDTLVFGYTSSHDISKENVEDMKKQFASAPFKWKVKIRRPYEKEGR